MKSRSKNKILTKKKFKLDLNTTKINLHEIEQQWLLGEWEALIKTDIKALIADSTAALYLVYIAIAYQQLNKAELSKKYIKLALEKGCTRKKVIDILLAGISYNLACLALLKKQDKKAKSYFELTTKIANEYFLADYHVLKNKMEMALYPPPIMDIINKTKHPIITHSNQAKLYVKNIHLHYLYPDMKKISPIKINTEQNLLNTKSYDFYNQLSDTPFILLDSKSLPRSGLHYMKKTLENLLKEQFSFCEWYCERWCCKKIPCGITGYAKQSNKEKISRIRLLKSHDFNLDDPNYHSTKILRRVILIRSILFILTSWFPLFQLGKYKKNLLEEGVKVEKIYLSHESEIVAFAYQIIDQQFIPPTQDELTNWLNTKVTYILGFINKWVLPTITKPSPYINIIHYEEINLYVSTLLKDLDTFPKKIQQNIDLFHTQKNINFNPRTEPFLSSSEKLSNYMWDNQSLFLKATSQVYQSMPKAVYETYFYNKF